MKTVLSLNILIQEAKVFCERMTHENHRNLIGITDGKAVGTYVEHRFQRFLLDKYIVDIGSSAKGIDFPGSNINTDIKVTSITQPQSSCPFKNARQKIFGLGYNLLVFVYEKHDTSDSCHLKFTHCVFIDKIRTSDFTITKINTELFPSFILMLSVLLIVISILPADNFLKYIFKSMFKS